MARQGPHHGAQKSTTVSPVAIPASKSAVVRSRMVGAMGLCMGRVPLSGSRSDGAHVARRLLYNCTVVKLKNYRKSTSTPWVRAGLSGAVDDCAQAGDLLLQPAADLLAELEDAPVDQAVKRGRALLAAADDPGLQKDAEVLRG